MLDRVRGLITRRLVQWAAILSIVMLFTSPSYGSLAGLVGQFVGGVLLWVVLLAAGKALRARIDRAMGWAEPVE